MAGATFDGPASPDDADVPPAEAPQWLVSLACPESADNPTSAVTTIFNHKHPVSDMLCYIDADNYQRWVTVGMALKHNFGDEGFDLWKEWSYKSPKAHKVKSFEAKWASFMVCLACIQMVAEHFGHWATTLCFCLHSDSLNPRVPVSMPCLPPAE